MSSITPAGDEYAGIRADIVSLLDTARRAAARSVNALMTATYWEVGRRIVEVEQAGKDRAGYGEALTVRLAADLSARFGRGFGKRNLEQMRLFYLGWPMEKIVQTASAQSPDLTRLAKAFPLPWSAYVQLLSVRPSEARAFYEAEALRCGWSVRQLYRQINSLFYERVAMSRNKAGMMQGAEVPQPGDAITPEQALRDPFVLEFLNLKDEYSETELEERLIQHLSDFLLELGDDFAFVGRQRRLRLDDSWFRVDLLLFHRRLKCLLLIDLKIGKFSHADAGQMHMYLNYAREHWMKPGENPPVGLMLCTGKGHNEAHYALDGLPNQIVATQYQTILPEAKRLAEEMDKTRQALEARQALKR